MLVVALLFRKLASKRYWDGQSWLSPGEAQADASRCLETTENQLSVYVLDTSEKQLDRVVAALALGRDHVSVFDLAVAPESVLHTCGIKDAATAGQTIDETVNGWHRDLVNLTMNNLASLAGAIREHGEIRRYNPRKVERVIETSIKAKYIDPRKLGETISASLKKRGII